MIERELESESQRRLRAAQRVVVKLGTSTVTGDGGEVCVERVTPLVRSMAALKGAGRQLVLVSSGAVGLGARAVWACVVQGWAMWPRGRRRRSRAEPVDARLRVAIPRSRRADSAGAVDQDDFKDWAALQKSAPDDGETAQARRAASGQRERHGLDGRAWSI